LNISDLLDELAASPNLPGAACRGQWQLFDSHDADDVAAAIKICHSCPALAACRQFVNALPPADRPHGCVVAGVVQRAKPRNTRTSPDAPVTALRAAALAAIAEFERTQQHQGSRPTR
jgi:hypothetical protein